MIARQVVWASVLLWLATMKTFGAIASSLASYQELSVAGLILLSRRTPPVNECDSFITRLNFCSFNKAIH
jgi:hypothetical protein